MTPRIAAFNELCLQDLSDSDAFGEKASNMFRSLASLRTAGVFNGEFYSSRDLPNLRLSDGKSVSSLLDRDLRRLALAFTHKYPAVAHITPEEADQHNLAECRCSLFSDSPGIGLSIAQSKEGIIASVAMQEQWATSTLDIQRTHLDEAPPHDFMVTNHVVDHTADATTATQVRTRMVEKFVNGCSLPELIRLWPVIFPHIDRIVDFDQFYSHLNGIHLQAFAEKTLKLNTAIGSWIKDTSVPISYEFDVRTDSESTLKMFAKERTFTCPHAGSQVFSWHASLPDGYRVYWKINASIKRITIGYVGPHLRTANFK